MISPRAAEALAKIEAIKADSERRDYEMKAPSRALELLFGVTESQMRECILKAREAGRNDTKQITLPPIFLNNSLEHEEALFVLFRLSPKEFRRDSTLGGPGMVLSYRGHRLVLGEKLEAV